MGPTTGTAEDTRSGTSETSFKVERLEANMREALGKTDELIKCKGTAIAEIETRKKNSIDNKPFDDFNRTVPGRLEAATKRFEGELGTMRALVEQVRTENRVPHHGLNTPGGMNASARDMQSPSLGSVGQSARC